MKLSRSAGRGFNQAALQTSRLPPGQSGGQPRNSGNGFPALPPAGGSRPPSAAHRHPQRHPPRRSRRQRREKGRHPQSALAVLRNVFTPFRRDKSGWSRGIRPVIIPAPSAGVAAFGRKPHFYRRRSAETPLRQRSPIRQSITAARPQQTWSIAPRGGSVRRQRICRDLLPSPEGFSRRQALPGFVCCSPDRFGPTSSRLSSIHARPRIATGQQSSFLTKNSIETGYSSPKLTWLEPGHPASDYSCPKCGRSGFRQKAAFQSAALCRDAATPARQGGFWFQLKSQKSRLGVRQARRLTSWFGHFFTVRRRLGRNTCFIASSNSSGKNGFCSTSVAPSRRATDNRGRANEFPDIAIIGKSGNCCLSSFIVSSPSRLGMNRSTSARSTGVEWYCRMPSNPSAAKTTS